MIYYSWPHGMSYTEEALILFRSDNITIKAYMKQ